MMAARDMFNVAPNQGRHLVEGEKRNSGFQEGG